MRRNHWCWALYTATVYWGLASYHHYWNHASWQGAAWSSTEIIPVMILVAGCSWFMLDRGDQAKSASRIANAILWLVFVTVAILAAFVLLLMLLPAFSVVWHWIRG